jgi:hypothetical protein
MKPLFAISMCLPLMTSQLSASEETARGIVFHDANGNRKHDEDEKPLAKMKVSNGTDIVITGEDGRYELPVSDDTIVFVIKPRGWRTPLSAERLPEFYYIHKPKGSPKLRYAGVGPTGPLPASVDFPLYPQDEPERFKAILFGDPQPRDQKEINFIAHDVVEELIGSDASFGVTLGDIMFDNLDLFKSLDQTIALIGIPWYNVIGNHDINYDATEDRFSDETFERNYGPAYYSFDYGEAHFLVLDDVEWFVPDGAKKGKYRGGFGKSQIEFIRNDLAKIPDEQMVVLLMHIPLVGAHDRQEVYRLIEKRPFCISVSGHTHHHEHRFIKKSDGWLGAKPHHHIINVTVSGSWWSGAPDERGIPHTMMADGAPNGYSIISFDGTKYSLDFKAAGRDTKYQMNIMAPESVSTGKLDQTELYVNVFNGSEKSTVEFQLGSNEEWHKMQRVALPDPLLTAVAAAEKSLTNKFWREMSRPKVSTHLWQAKLSTGVPMGTHLIRVRTTDMHGRTFYDGRVIKISEEETPEQ